jgi:MFS family permease
MSGARTQAARTAAVALGVTLAIQVFASLAATATSVLAPEIARDVGVAPKLVGVFVGLVYMGSMAASLASGGFIERFGAIRVSQVCVLCCAAGAAAMPAIASAGTGYIPLLAIAPLVIGLGYGPITPASSQVLARTAPPARMALTFSIKQTGVPAGAALAGAVLPGVALAIGWRAAFVAVAVVGVLIAILAQTTRSGLDADRHPARMLSLAGMFAPLKLVLASPTLIELSLVAFFYAATQVCLMSFLVVYLTETLRFSLVAAGFALTVANLGGIVGRIAWGGVADHFIRPRALLGLLGIVAAACAFATAAFSTAWSTVAQLAVCALFGATAIGWNGVQLAEVARHSPPGQAGAVTGAAGFVTFAGVVVGPPAFALLAAITGSYRTGFVTFGTASLLCGLVILLRSR